MRTRIEMLQCVRKELEAHYVPLVYDERDGYRNYSGTGEGCCVLGALGRCHAMELRRSLDKLAVKLHEELIGVSRQRLLAIPSGATPLGLSDKEGSDSFNENPALYVNNHLGKAAILAVIDEAIRAETEGAENAAMRKEMLAAVS